MDFEAETANRRAGNALSGAALALAVMPDVSTGPLGDRLLLLLIGRQAVALVALRRSGGIEIFKRDFALILDQPHQAAGFCIDDAPDGPQRFGQ